MSSPASAVCLPPAREASQQPPPRGLLSRLTEWREKREHRETAGKRPPGLAKSTMTHTSVARGSRSKIYLSRLHQMCSSAAANMEFSRRLLERSGQFADADSESRTRGLLDHVFPSGHRQRGEQPQERMGRPRPAGLGPRPGVQPPLSFLRCDSLASGTKDSNQRTRGHHTALGGMINLPEHTRGEPASPEMTTAPGTTAPLTLEQAIQMHRVVEAKTASRYWTNYVD
ncbi:uncharacterized protein LOC125121487 [Phacochoerus africanus]|uniref:uncharacterized protein LOC125121487 n=1 Tax=Phacochoerus africanus TaxID=41426 RepID=UPI001FD90038|nr:uncharacterized protein LOC125121487 [Phacochoerus africanus]XP_047625722.1 uncharacterized protein LOC125121487 [Phacochoerus africanus]